MFKFIFNYYTLKTKIYASILFNIKKTIILKNFVEIYSQAITILVHMNLSCNLEEKLIVVTKKYNL